MNIIISTKQLKALAGIHSWAQSQLEYCESVERAYLSTLLRTTGVLLRSYGK